MDKILIITKHVSLRYENEQIIIEGEENKKIPLYQIGTVIINSLMVSFTAFLLNQLHKNKIKIIFCDEKFNPYSEIVNYSDNYNSPVRLKNQISLVGAIPPLPPCASMAHSGYSFTFTINIW